MDKIFIEYMGLERHETPELTHELSDDEINYALRAGIAIKAPTQEEAQELYDTIRCM